MTIKDGGPAFPLKEPLTCDSEGMALRDYFAAKAMAGIIASSSDEATDWPSLVRIANRAYGQADAMLAARATP